MGNVQASFSNLPSMPPTPPPGPQENKMPEKRIENPGTVEDLHKKCKDIFPLSFDGIRLIINKQPNNHFYVNHTLMIRPTNQHSGYLFGSTFVGTKLISPGDYSLILAGEIDPRGNISTNVIIHPWDRVKLRLHTRFQKFKTSWIRTSTEYRADRYTATLCLVNPDLYNYTGMYTSQFLYALNDTISLGCEVVHQRSPQVPDGQITFYNILGRYLYDDNTTISASLGLFSLQCCYHFKASEQLQFGAEFEGNILHRDYNATIGYQAQIPKSDIIIKGSVDRKWNIITTLEKQLNPMPFTLTLSAAFSPVKHHLMMGIIFVVE